MYHLPEDHTALENYSDRRGLLSGVVYEFVLGYEFIHPECTYSAFCYPKFSEILSEAEFIHLF